MENFQLNDNLYGFRLKNKRDIQEAKGILYEFSHEATGARLYYLSTNDQNKHFSVSFKTLPEDDSGVFHILEHSVLCGSDKYPVKEPFVELLKSSMNTFLNAMTFPDKTMYPVSSKNEQDFLNLTDVYLDAVFKPAIYHNKKIFEQEGWHYELRDPNDPAVYKGVVLNEMKGSTSSLDTMIDNEIMRMLYPDNCYRFISGGDPQSITKLTYEKFLSQHQKYYHPSNAYFYVEGDLILEKVLAKIAGYLKNYKPNHESYELVLQTPIKENIRRTRYYPLAEGEKPENKTQITFAKIAADFDDTKKIFAINILSDYLTGSNEAPLKKAILDADLAEDAYAAITDGLQQPYFEFFISNTEADRYDEIVKITDQVIKDILEKGINKKQLEASLNALEFATRDIGEPKGLIHNMQVLSSVLYGGDAAAHLSYGAAFKQLREALTTDYYEKTLKEMFNHESVASLIMIPDDTLSVKQRQAEEAELAEIKAGWDDEMIQAVIEENKAIDEWHNAPDRPEALATIPKLALSDVAPLPEKLETEEKMYDGVRVLVHPSDIEGVVHFCAYFTLDVATHEELSAYSFLTNLLGCLPTKRSLTDFIYDTKANTGRLLFDFGSTSIPGDRDHVQVYLIAKASALKSKVSDAIRLIKEVLTETDFDRKDYIKPLLVQTYDDFRNDIIANGHRYAMRKAMASTSKEAFFNEVVDGLDAYQYLGDLVKNFDEKSDAFISYLKEALRQLNRNRMMISVTTDVYDQELEEELVKPLIEDYPKGEAVKGASFAAEPAKNVGVVIPNGVSYASLANNLYHFSDHYSGIWQVVSTLLSYNYLWNEVRVKGGAYGTGFACGSLGTLAYYSYRDPSVHTALETYKHAGDFIRAFVNSDEDIDDYIISTVAKSDPLRSPRIAGEVADGNYLRHITYEDQCRSRKEKLTMKKEDLLPFADILDELGKDHIVAVIGHSGEIEACKDQLDEVITL